MNFMENLENEQIEEQTLDTQSTGDMGQEAETPKLYSEEEFRQKVNEQVDGLLASKIGRREAKLRKEYDDRYGPLVDVLKAGTGKDSVEEITEAFRQHYAGRGINVPRRDAISEEDIQVLANNDAQGIIQGGYEEVRQEMDRLGAVGTKNMNSRDKAVYSALEQYRQSADRGRELSSIGVPKEVYDSAEFQSFAEKFTQKTPAREIYDLYAKTHNTRKEVNNPGSMKNLPGKDTGVKDFYSRDEALKFTRADLDKSPELMKAIENSMRKW